MRESLCLYGLLLLGLLVARGWGQYDYYDYGSYGSYSGYPDYTDSPTTEPPTDPPVCEFPGAEQLTADNISFSYTVNARLFEHVDVVISWVKPEEFERVTGYTVKISSLTGCGIPMDYEVGPTQTSLALESNETTHPFISSCFYNVQVIVNPRCPSDEIGENVLFQRYADVVRNEIQDNAVISCPAEFNDTALRYSVNLTWTLPISPILLESINRFIIRTVRVNARDPVDVTGIFGDSIPILNTDPSRMSYSFPITYAPIFLPNTAYNISLQVIWNSERAIILPITNLNCHVGTLLPAGPGEVMDFSETERNIEEDYTSGSRIVVVDVAYTWSNVQLQQTPDEIPVVIDYQVAFVSDSPLSPGASSTGLQIDQYLGDMSTGVSRRRFQTSEPIFNAYLQIRARSSYSSDPPLVLVGNWSDPIVVTADIFDPPAPEEIQTLTIINSAILDTMFIRESASVLVSVQVEFEWTEPVLLFGDIQEYEAWLNLRSLGEDENPENGIHTFDAEDRAGTITADFTMTIADGPTTTFRLILQIRARSEFSAGPWSEPLVQSITVEVPLEIHFIGNTPRVTGDTVGVQFTMNRPAALVRCDMDRVGRQDCSSGNITFTGLAAGRHSLRVTATNGRRDRAVERRRIEIPADPSMCVVNLINDGVTVVRDSVTVEFTTIGPAESLLCKLDLEEAFPCTSPVALSGVNAGRHRLRIVPQGCGRNHHVLIVKFDI